MRKKILLPLMIAAAILMIGCAGSAIRETAPVRHPEELTGEQADCLECHDNGLSGTLKPFETFSHSTPFLLRHGDYALQGQDLCSSCHGESFCMSCHPTEESIRPDIRFGNQPDRQTVPHRGDYLVQHRIDGRVDPGSCFRCHGNRNEETCLRCHR